MASTRKNEDKNTRKKPVNKHRGTFTLLLENKNNNMPLNRVISQPRIVITLESIFLVVSR
jgi:hypothetical protein